jgi:hypothetical protein
MVFWFSVLKYASLLLLSLWTQGTHEGEEVGDMQCNDKSLVQQYIIWSSTFKPFTCWAASVFQRRLVWGKSKTEIFGEETTKKYKLTDGFSFTFTINYTIIPF